MPGSQPRTRQSCPCAAGPGRAPLPAAPRRRPHRCPGCRRRTTREPLPPPLASRRLTPPHAPAPPAPRVPPCWPHSRARCARRARARPAGAPMSKTRPMWLASAAQAADWRWLAEAWSSLSHDLEASGDPPGRSLCHLVSSIAVRLLRCGRLLRCRRGVGHLGVLAVKTSTAAAPRAKRLLDLDGRRLSARPYARRSVSSRSVSVLVLPCTSFLWVGFVCGNPIQNSSGYGSRR